MTHGEGHGLGSRQELDGKEIYKKGLAGVGAELFLLSLFLNSGLQLAIDLLIKHKRRLL